MTQTSIKLPDGPSPSTLFRRLSVIQWIFRPLEVLEARSKKYGDPFIISKNITPLVVYFSHPKAVEQIMTADPELFEIARGNDMLIPLVGVNSLLLLDGMKHQRQRKLLMPPFHGDRLRTYGQQICDITNHVISGWKVGESVTMRAATQEITLRVILTTVFGLYEGDRYDQLRKLLTSMLDSVASPLSSTLLFFPSLQKDWGAWSPWGRFLRLKQQIDSLLIAEIQARRQQRKNGGVAVLKSWTGGGDTPPLKTRPLSASPPPIFSKTMQDLASPAGDDILSLLLQARDEAGQPMTDEELRDELITLLFAGHETTASALAWAFYWVDRLPEVREKLHKEIDTLAANADPSRLGKLNEVIARLPYLSAVCYETLRIYPIALNPFPRILKAPMEIMGYQFDKGTILLASTYLTHQREDIYPEPKRFKPERFLERQFSPYEYYPFGGSNRRCIGSAFALLEMKLALFTILSRYELKLVGDRPIKPTRRGVTVAPPANMRMMVTQRQPQKTPVLV